MGTNVKGSTVDEVETRTVTIDEYFAGADPEPSKSVRLVKIDTQGHELSVLQGMRKMLTESTREFVVIFEVAAEMQRAVGHDPRDIINFMAKAGWSAYCLQHETWVDYAD